MTDRQPDDLYDALRDRLADYGQEPPAPLWANIRAQLPPPVAAPQLRQRTHRRRLAALALLLLFVSVGTWQWRQLRYRPAGQALPAGRLATLATRHQPTTTASQPTDFASAVEQPHPVPTNKAIAGTTTHDSSDVKRQASSDALAAVAAGSGRTNNYSSPTNPAAASPSRPATTTRTWPAGATGIAAVRPTKLAATRTATSIASSGRAAGRMGRPDANTAASRTAASAVALVGADAAVRDAARPSASTRLRGGARTTTSIQKTTAGTAYQPPALAHEELQSGKIAQYPTQAATLTAQAAEVAAVPLAIGLRLPALSAPVLLAPVDTLPPLPVALVRRWAVQVLAGPALTSRTLQTGKLAYAPYPASIPSNYTNRNVLTTSSAQSEQAAAGFGAEVQLQRQLTGRWSFSTGLGYHTFATNQTVNVLVRYTPTVTTAPFPDSTGTSSVRNTYHFLTVPLRVGYQLGAGHSRLRYALQAGADVAFYLGGRSAEGSTSGIVSQNWGASGSPYRPLSLALSLGAEVRYRLAPGWEVLAQPTFTHFVTSVAQPSSGYVVRYPLAATALVGVAYWLH